jgi:hypothetical protein
MLSAYKYMHLAYKMQLFITQLDYGKKPAPRAPPPELIADPVFVEPAIKTCFN